MRGFLTVPGAVLVFVLLFGVIDASAAARRRGKQPPPPARNHHKKVSAQQIEGTQGEIAHPKLVL